MAKARLEKEIEKIAADIVKFEKKLANKGFLAKASEMVVEENRDHLDEAQSARTKLEEALGRLAAG